MLLDQLNNYREGIVALQEMRWTGKGTLEKYKGTILYGCDKKKHFLGTGFIVHKKLKHPVTGFSPIIPRLATLKVKGFLNYSIVNAYAPTEDSEDKVKGDFHDALEKAYDACPENDIKIVAGAAHFSDFQTTVKDLHKLLKKSP
jgi:exonuclease III